MATTIQLPLQAGHPIVDPRTGLLTPPWVIFFQHLIRNVSQAAVVPIDLGSEVTGDLPWSSIVPVSAANRLLGRGDSGPGDVQEIHLGSGLTMVGTTLTLTGGAGYWTPITNGDPLSPEVIFDSNGDCVVGFVPTP